MAEQYRLIGNITPETRAWIAKIRIFEKGMPRTSQNHSKRFQRLVLVDEEGTQVQATIFDKDIELFKSKLNVLRSYYISNATIMPIDEVNKIVDNNYQWTINNYTAVEEIMEDDIPKLSSLFNFVPFANLEEHLESQIDLFGVVLEINHPRDIHTRNGPQRIQKLLLVDQSSATITLTSWNHFIDNECAAIQKIINERPIVIVTRIKVTSFNGISVQTKASSSFIINPPVPETAELKSWYNANKSQFENISPSNRQVSPKIDIIQIAEIQNLNEGQNIFWIKANLQITNLYQTFWYMSCNNCQRAIDAILEEKFQCQHCYKKEAVALPRCRIEIQLKDNSGTIIATMFDDKAENILSCSATKLMAKSNEETIEDIKQLQATNNTKEYIVETKIMKNRIRGGGVQHKFFVLSLSETTSNINSQPTANIS